jgi:hypothetical protein
MKLLTVNLKSYMSQIGFVLSTEEYLLIAAQMLGHSDFEDFQKSLEMPDRTDRLLHIEEGRTADLDPLYNCHILALEMAGLSIDEAAEFASALLADQQWITGVRPLPLMQQGTWER